jgi:hypothetical protein
MVRIALVASAALWCACGGASSSPKEIGNLGGGGGAGVTVDPAGPLGMIALPASPAPLDDAPYWVATSPDASVVVPDTGSTPLVAGTKYAALSAAGGAPVELTAGAVTTIGYGCDKVDLQVVPLSGARVPPALVWVLPSPLPAGWSPAAVPLTVEQQEKSRRRWKAGTLDLEITRTDATHASLRVGTGDRTLHTQAVEAYFMEGSDEIDLDFTEGRRPGIPFPEAVYAIAPGGPHLVVLDTSGYEGVSFTALLVTQESGSHEIESASTSAYYCAF